MNIQLKTEGYIDRRRENEPYVIITQTEVLTGTEMGSIYISVPQFQRLALAVSQSILEGETDNE